MSRLIRTRPSARLLSAAVALALPAIAPLAPVPAFASASSAASSASESVGFSIGSISGSLKNSSGSSSKAADVAEGDYEIVDIMALAGDPERVALRLRAPAVDSAAAASAEIVLELPRRTAEQARLAPGHIVSARQRVYGIEFASGEPREAFFLALDDDWMRELRVRAVGS